jgi:glycosyltransferase involved in cell wall biosynthesis
MFASQLSQHLEPLGHQVILISLFPGDVALPFSGQKMSLNRPVFKRFLDYQGWKDFAVLIRKYNPDIIQCNAGDTLKFAVMSKKIFGWKQPIVARNASMISLYINNPFVKWINHWLYHNVDFVLSVSENSKKDVNTLFPSTVQKSAVIPVGIELPTTMEVDWKGGIEAKHHIIHVGGFSFEKNHERLLYIFKSVLEQLPDTHLHLLGEGPKKEAIQLLAQSLQLNDKITFYGWISNPLDYICKAGVLVLPSVIEGLPGVILEAMSCKVPVVAYNVGGIPEVVKDGQTGFLVEKNDEAVFAQTIVKVLKYKKETVLQNAFDLVHEKYNNKVLAKQFEIVYKELIK